MREDMYKVIVERPRRGKSGDSAAARLRRDFDGPMRLGMRAGYGRNRRRGRPEDYCGYILRRISRSRE